MLFRARRCAIASLVLASSLGSGTARADFGDDFPIWAWLAGPNLGVSQRGDDIAALAGLELSAPISWGYGWLGPYTDIVYDGDARWTVGPEVGLLVFGLDGGLLVDFAKEGTETGYVVRPSVTIPAKLSDSVFVILCPYWRYGKVSDRSFTEMGFLMKLPVWDDQR